jgi:hypothetical protein
MKFMVEYHVTDQDKVLPIAKRWSSMSPQERAVEPGEGIKKIGAWHAGRRGVVIIESSDLPAVMRWVYRWNPYMEVAVTPVVDEEESAEIARQVVTDNGDV